MVAACMKTYDSDEDLGEITDPDLLAELQDMQEPEPVQPVVQQPEAHHRQEDEQGVGHSIIQTIRDRLVLYREAEQIAVSEGNTSKARRANRGVKTLQELERRAVRGGAVAEADIPPPISTGRKPTNTSQETSNETSPDSEQAPVPAPAPAPVPVAVRRDPTPPPPAPTPRVPTAGPASQMAELKTWKEHYKNQALAAKEAGNKEVAINNMKYYKMCSSLMSEVESGSTVDLTPILPQSQAPANNFSRDAPLPVVPDESSLPPSNPEQYGAPPAPTTIAEALNQRLLKYKGEADKAKADNNGSKARRYGRIVKQYQDAIKLHASGRPIPRDTLPDPPGFAAIPVTDGPQAAQSQSPAPSASAAAVAGSAAAVAPRPTPSAAAVGQ